MKKYWALSIAFVTILLVSTVIIRFSVDSGQVLGEASIPTINPTEYIKMRLTEGVKIPTPHLTEAARKNANPNTSGLLDKLKASTASSEKKPNATPSGTLNAFKAKLDAQKLKMCQERSKLILMRSTQMIEMVSSAEAKFSTVAETVKAYYVSKKLTLASYDKLVSSLDTKKASLASLIVIAKADVTNFSCTGENPSLQLKKYKDDMQAVLDTLHEYRTAIHTLIEAIKGIKIPTITPKSSL